MFLLLPIICRSFGIFWLDAGIFERIIDDVLIKTSMFHCQVELPALQMARIGQEFFRHCSAPMAFDPVKGRYLKVDSVTNSCARRRTVGHRWFEPGFKIPTSMLSFPMCVQLFQDGFSKNPWKKTSFFNSFCRDQLFATVGGTSTVTCLTTRSSTPWWSTLARRWWDKPMRRGRCVDAGRMGELRVAPVKRGIDGAEW